MPEPSAPCTVNYAVVTDVGRRREQNEDAHGEFTLPGGDLLLVVADGMGGHQGGEVASRIAVEALGHIAQHSPAQDPREKLHNGLLVAHQRVVTHAESAGIRGMGTTAVAVYLRGNEAYVPGFFLCLPGGEAALQKKYPHLIERGLVIEPFLLQQGYLARTARGRVATRHAYEHLKKTMPGRRRGPGDAEPQGELF